jgi:23S rRNA G2069 N7-methylase RlmK/C1962 C5-methylase RlmI
VRTDTLKWLSENRAQRFGLIYINPPSFSRSKRLRDVPDVQRDHVNLIRAAAVSLEPDGALIFSTHLRRFNLDRRLPSLPWRICRASHFAWTSLAGRIASLFLYCAPKWIA